MTKQELVYVTINEWASTPFMWGTSDCGKSVAKYVYEACGRDPAREMHGQYKTRNECYKWIKAHYGSVLAMAEAGFAGAGLSETSVPELGDVGVVKLEGTNYYVIALYDGHLWSTRMRNVGIYSAKAKVLKAWRVECLQ